MGQLQSGALILSPLQESQFDLSIEQVRHLLIQVGQFDEIGKMS
jgi:hypothetical protein